MGKAPQLSQGGNGGAYFLKGVDGKPAAVFKPADEEPFAPNNPRGHRSSLNGEGMRKGTKAGRARPARLRRTCSITEVSPAFRRRRSSI